MAVHTKFLGINNVDAPERLEQKDGLELREAANVDIDSSGKVTRRKGFNKIYNGTNIHSLFSNQEHTLFVEDGALSLLNSDYTATVLQTGLSRFGRVAYQDIDGDIYFSDGNTTGIYSDGSILPMGIPTPPTKPVLMSGSGILPAGRYGVIFTAVDSIGRESGSTFAEFIDLDADSAITVSGFPAALAGATAINVYVTTQNGDVFYQHGQAALGASSYEITNPPTGHQCRTRFKDQMPAGHLMGYHRGRLYVAVNKVVYFSDPYNPGLTDVTKNFIMFPERVTLIAPVEQGIFFSDEKKTYYMNGTDPDDAAMRKVADYPAMENTGTEIEPGALADGVSGETWMWSSKKGVCVGLEGGEFKNLTENKYALRTGDIGAALFRQRNGINQYLGIIKADDSAANNLYTSDVAVAEVRRNGVIIT